MKYYVRVRPGYNSMDEVCYVYITIKRSVNEIINFPSPNALFKNDELCNKYGIIGTCILCVKSIDDKKTYFPCATYVLHDHRGKGFGKLLYMTCLAIINKREMKPGIRFVQHQFAESIWGTTSKQAKRLYSSLTKAGYLSKVKSMVYETKKYPRVLYRTTLQF